MNPEVNQETVSPDLTAEEVVVQIDNDDVGTLTQFSSETQASNEQWRQIGEKVSEFLSYLPDYLTEFFSEYKRPIITVGLVVGALIAVKLTLAVLDAVNDIPLLAPTFELIGFGYSAWFVYRYLLRASNRKELANDFNSLKEQVLGRNALKE
ncbi:CAAD domain-containing protein [Oculatella sp. LEGE 06141]|uniref:CAAD domain-containing protein n=1 Tax=Oculatella sp. LEGE 06141 TaxID=1828648 RepID=UPI00188090E2|nr:CAAD domain-containing protein [Oculatella sp. LEGE 06141]MBE9181834.1 CAAD domain-containing protein [Oculatella sp. LEGE 06141]